MPPAGWADAQIARMERGGRLGSYRKAPGTGERSYVYKSGNSNAVLCVFGSDSYLQISVAGMGAANTTALGKVARTALQRQKYFQNSAIDIPKPTTITNLRTATRPILRATPAAP